jgi:tRNA A-37 threonylcarbamoyl transferase component Bud32
MAELSVRTHFTNSPRTLALTALRITFPVWGVISPIIGISIMVGVYFSIIGSGIGGDTFTALCCGAALLASAIIGLLTIHWLSKDALVIDKAGVTLPFSLIRPNRNLGWAQIKAVQVNRAQDKSWQRKELALITSGGVSKVQLSHFKPDAIEKIVLAIEMWGQNAALDTAVQALKDEATGSSPDQLSYTDMWEDELSRRFNPTAFVPLEPGRMVRNGSLKIVRHLALGGLSAVYLGQLEDRKLVVLKEAVVSDDATESAQSKAKEMLEREAAMLLKLSHPNIVKVMDHFVEQGRNYVMLEYINGQDLRQLVRQNGPQKEPIILEWALQMATILKYMHEQEPPVIHRDFTPDNLVLCEDGSIALIDFGAANEFIGNATGTFVGKHAFIAPEQFRGKAVVQSDLYAFGCTLYFLLTGKEPEALSCSNPDEAGVRVSAELSQLIQTCTQMESRDRYQSAAQLIPILRGLAASLPSLA